MSIECHTLIINSGTHLAEIKALSFIPTILGWSYYLFLLIILLMAISGIKATIVFFLMSSIENLNLSFSLLLRLSIHKH